MNYPAQLQAELLPKGALPELVYTLPEMQIPEEVNIAEHFLDRNLAGDQAHRIAFYSGDRACTYQALRQMVNRFANGLRGLGIGPGDRVMLRIPNCIEFVISALALHRLGAVVVPTMSLLREKMITTIANTAEARAVISAHDLLGDIEAGRDRYRTVEHIVAIGGDRAEMKGRGYQRYEEMVESSRDQIESVKVNADDLAAIFFSSGTTGNPKGCMQTHRVIIGTEYVPPYLYGGIHPPDVVGGVPPLAFVFGYGHIMLVPLLCGVPSALIEGRVTAEKMFETIQKYRITLFNGAPAAYNQMLTVPDVMKRYDLSSIRLWMGGGAPLMAATWHQWKAATGMELGNTMGSSETYQSYISTWKSAIKPGSVGYTNPGWEARILDEQGNDCPQGTIGRLAVRGPGGVLYWRDPERQKESVIDGWSLTGDLAYQDEDGCYWHVSRSDDIIKSRGYRVSPGEVEDALAEHPAVFDPGVVGSPDPIQGEKVKAFVVLREGYQGSPELAEDLRQFARARVAAYAAPSEIEFVSSLPKTETGKVRRVELRQLEQKRYAERQLEGTGKEQES